MSPGPVGSPMPRPPSNHEITMAVLVFSVSSIGMMTGNKLATNYLPLPSALVIIQALCTIVPILTYKECLPMQRALATKWLPVAFLFSAMLFTSMMSFLYANVSTILVFRNIATIISTIVEFFVRGKGVTPRIVMAEFTIVAGCMLYGWTQLDFSWVGFFWIMLNVVAQVTYGNLLKVYLSTVRDPATGEELNKFTCSYYNNVLALPFILATLFFFGEHKRIVPVFTGMTITGWAVVAFTCVVGYFISTSGFALAKLVSATTFLVVNNMVKIINILMGMFLLNDRFSSWQPALGCLIALGAGVWYSAETNAMNQKQVQKPDSDLEEQKSAAEALPGDAHKR